MLENSAHGKNMHKYTQVRDTIYVNNVGKFSAHTVIGNMSKLSLERNPMHVSYVGNVLVRGIIVKYMKGITQRKTCV